MRMKNPKLPAVVAATLLLSLSCAYAADDARIEVTSGEFKTPVVELYTSEGCSSCPRADNWLRKLGQTLDRDFSAVLLAFHVDYWNYLGWTDPYSKPAFTARQREAAANNRQRNIYTPEFMVDGREARGGTNIIRSIQTANLQKAEATIVLSVTRHGANAIRARIDVDNGAHDGGAYRAHLAIYESGITRQIGGGENHGRTLKHDFVVRHWSAPIAIRRGANQAGVDVDIPADWNKPNLGLAVVVQKRDTFETLQAVNTSLAALFPG